MKHCYSIASLAGDGAAHKERRGVSPPCDGSDRA